MTGIYIILYTINVLRRRRFKKIFRSFFSSFQSIWFFYKLKRAWYTVLQRYRYAANIVPRINKQYFIRMTFALVQVLHRVVYTAMHTYAIVINNIPNYITLPGNHMLVHLVKYCQHARALYDSNNCYVVYIQHEFCFRKCIIPRIRRADPPAYISKSSIRLQLYNVAAAVYSGMQNSYAGITTLHYIIFAAILSQRWRRKSCT